MDVKTVLETIEPSTPQQISDDFEKITVDVSGYIGSVRVQGKKLIFLDIYDSYPALSEASPKLQIVLISSLIQTSDQIQMDLCDWCKLLAINSKVDVHGYASRSNTGFFSIISTRFPIIQRISPHPFHILRLLKFHTKISNDLLGQALQIDNGESLESFVCLVDSPHFNQLWDRCVAHGRNMEGKPIVKVGRIRPPRFTDQEIVHLETVESSILAVAASLDHDGSGVREKQTANLWCSNECKQKWDIHPLDPQELSLELKSVSWGKLDPKFNIPPSEASNEARLEYIENKKKPQIAWITSRMKELLLNRVGPQNLWGKVRILDVGGGRGDMALMLARELKLARIVVIDLNRPSLEDGMKRSKELGLSERMEFECADVRDVIKKYLPNGNGPKEEHIVLVGLHACGGLSEFLISAALSVNADFMVCTCCFNSNPSLCTLLPPPIVSVENSMLDTMQPEDLSVKPSIPSGSTMRILRRMAESQVTELSDKSMRCLNALRLHAVIRDSHKNGNVYDVKLLSFPKLNSDKNLVLAGWPL